MVLSSLSFRLSVKLLISPLYLNEILAGYSNLSSFSGTSMIQMLGVSPWVYPVWDSLGFLDLEILPILGKFSTIISSSIV